MKKILLLLFVVLSLQASVQAQSGSGKDEALKALGGTGGLLLYDSYLVIGEAADAFSRDVYTPTEVEKIVQEQIGGIGTVQEQYSALLATKFLTDPSDRDYVEELSDAFGLVMDEGKALIDYVNSGNEEDASEFEARRVAAWKKISTLLGFDE